MEGFVLVGGASSRFGGNKALALWQGRPLVEFPLRALAGLGLTPRLVGPEVDPYRSLALAFVLAEIPGRGPLGGVIAALACCRDSALILTADMPEVTGDHLRALTRAAGTGDRPVCFTQGGRRHPFPGFYPRGILEELRSLPPEAAMQAALDRSAARTLEAESLPPSLGPARGFRNVNRPGDLDSRPESN
jgi:molybdopterin-guanine dinucleotide biosynthesis protein A